MHAFFETRAERIFCRMTQGMHFPLHLHSQLEIYLLTSGSAIVQVQNTQRLMEAGEMAVMFPNQIHSYQAMTPDTKAAMIICDPSLTGAYAQTLLGTHPATPFLSADMLHEQVPFAVHALIEEGKEDSAANGPLVQLLLARVLPRFTLIRNQRQDQKEVTYGIVQYIAQHFKEPLTLDVLAEALGISKYHLSHLFSGRIGASFPSYLASIRLSYACTRLRESTQSVTEIAMDAGFESHRTFFRVFKERFGVTPAAYRKMMQLRAEKDDG